MIFGCPAAPIGLVLLFWRPFLYARDRSVRKRPLLVWRMAWLCGAESSSASAGGYVITPFGYFHPRASCARRGETLLAMGASNMRMERPMRTLRPAVSTLLAQRSLVTEGFLKVNDREVPQ